MRDYDFSGAYKDYFTVIYRYCFRRLTNQQETEDVVSEVFTAAWKNWSMLSLTGRNEDENRKKVKNWLFAITRHKLNDFLRRKYKFTAKFSDSDVEHLADTEEESYDGEKNNNSNPKTNILSELVSELRPREQLYIKLRFQQNYKLIEVADAMGITVNNAKVMQNRLIKKLKSSWLNYDK